jgi:hypothetical protein
MNPVPALAGSRRNPLGPGEPAVHGTEEKA